MMAQPKEFLQALADLMERHDVADISVCNANCSEGSWDGATIELCFADGTDFVLNHDTYFDESHIRKILKKVWRSSQTEQGCFVILSLLVTQSREGEGRVGECKALAWIMRTRSKFDPCHKNNIILICPCPDPDILAWMKIKFCELSHTMKIKIKWSKLWSGSKCDPVDSFIFVNQSTMWTGSKCELDQNVI